MELKNLTERLLSFLQGKDKSKKLNILIMVGAFGIMLIILANSFSPARPEVKISSMPDLQSSRQKQDLAVRTTVDIVSIESIMSKTLEDVLSQIEGVGGVKATVNLASTMEYEYAVNTSTINKTTEEKDQKGGNRLVTEVNEDGQVVLIREGEGSKEVPVVKREIKPNVQGVVVVAEGADDPEVKAQLLDAVQVFLNVSPHRVVVLPKESR